MTRGEELCTAIQGRDTATLLRMAAEARREEDRIFLALLAQLVGRQPELDAHPNDSEYDCGRPFDSP